MKLATATNTILLVFMGLAIARGQSDDPGASNTIDEFDTDEKFDTVCGGTRFRQSFIRSNTTVELGRVPAGLYKFAVHLWSEEDLDLQISSGKEDDETIVVHRRDGIVQSKHRVVTKYNSDTFTYSGHAGIISSGGPGNENILFRGFTQNPYRILVTAHEDGHAKIRYGWLPISSCNITESRYKDFDVEQLRRNLRGLGDSSHHRSLVTANVINDGNYNIIHGWVQGHTELSYSACWNAIRNTDQNPSNSGQVIGIHSRKGIWKSYQDGSSSCGGNRNDCWNREHVWPKSRGDFSTRRGAGTDLHALRAEDRSVNTERSNKNIDYVSGGTPVPDCPDCWESSTAFEPSNAGQGPVARMLFYMAVRYNGDSDSNGVSLNLYNGGNIADCCGSAGRLGDLGTLKRWATTQPVTSEERRRNDMIEAYYQGNRNPFIDNPQFINYVW